jgi:hypothetical protein
MPDCDLFPIHLGRCLELCRSQLSRGGREEASFVEVEHVLDGPALDEGGMSEVNSAAVDSMAAAASR